MVPVVQRWRYEDSGPRAGVFNMERDEALARALQGQGADGAQVLRLYGWDPPAISLGHHQDASTIDQDRLQRDGFELVRRPTGGRAILHHEELTYCVAMLSGRRYSGEPRLGTSLAVGTLSGAMRYCSP